MDESISATPTPKTAAEYRAAVDAMVRDIRRMHARMDRNREEINQLKEETNAIKAETEQIKARVRSRLADLRVWMG
jgi:peptidoglycan hydrolase CwlO-like protein